MNWLSDNWFSVFVAIGTVLGWAIHYGISTQKGRAVAEKVTEIEKAILDVEKNINIHVTNSDIHVSPTLLQLFNERDGFLKLQLTELRNDIQRVETAVVK